MFACIRQIGFFRAKDRFYSMGCVLGVSEGCSWLERGFFSIAMGSLLFSWNWVVSFRCSCGAGDVAGVGVVV